MTLFVTSTGGTVAEAERLSSSSPLAPSKPSRDQRLTPTRRSASETAYDLAAHLVALVDAREQTHPTRRRRRTEREEAIHRLTVEAIGMDLLHLHLRTMGQPDPTPRVMVSLSKQHIGTASRYRAPIESKAFPKTLAAMEAAGLIKITKGVKARYAPLEWDEDDTLLTPTEDSATTIEAGPVLLALFADGDWSFADLRTEGVGETIIQKDVKPFGKRSAKALPYKDTPETIAMRAALAEINDWIGTLDMEVVGNDDLPRTIDVWERTLRRIFNNGRFDHGGRIFGGWWEILHKLHRHRIRLAGEPVVSVDYGSMFLRLAYARVGINPGDGDLYDIPGLRHLHRDAIKVLVNAMLFRTGKLKKWPVVDDADKHTPWSWPSDISASEAARLVLHHHAPIADLFGRGVGFELMHEESEILMLVLRACKDAGIPALPLHDAVLVPESKAAVVKAIMERVFVDRVGVAGVVKVG